MTRTLDQMQSKWEKIARTFSRNWGVNVQLSGTACDFSGTTIRIPANADYLKGAKQECLEGMLDHEIAHAAEEVEAEARRKDGKRPMSPLDIMRRQTGNNRKMLFNIYEDIRIEAKYSQKYPGMASNMRANGRHSVELHRAQMEATPYRQNFWHLLGCGIIGKAQGLDASWLPEGMQKILSELAPEIRDANVTRNALDVQALVERTLTKLDEMKKEVEEERERQEEKKREEEEKKQASQGSQGEEGEEAEGEGEGEGGEGEGEEGDQEEGSEGSQGSEEGEGKEEGSKGSQEGEEEGEEEGEGSGSSQGSQEGEEEEGEGEGSEEGSEGSQGEEEGSQGASEGSEGEEEGSEGSEEGESEEEGAKAGRTPGKPGKGSEDEDEEGMSEEELEAMEEAFEGMEREAETKDLTENVRTEIQEASERDANSNRRWLADPLVVAEDEWRIVEGGSIARYDELRKAVNKQVHAMRSRLLTLLRARTQARRERDKDRGRLDRGSLHKLCKRNASKRVFTQKVEAQDMDTCVSILIDQSASMGRGVEGHLPVYYATLTAIAVAEALEALGIDFEIVGFNNEYRGHGHRGASHRAPYTRFMPFGFDIYKAFGENFRQVKARLSQVTDKYENVDPEAVYEMAKRIAVRPEKRKIMLVLSDGNPLGGTIPTVARAELKRVVKRISKAGIEIYGIGFGSNASEARAVENYYNEENGSANIVIPPGEIDKLAERVFKLLSSKLMNGAKVA